MNGFSVCNKLKKDPALKDVPLIIMSSESSDETFEQHRKLRTRAEDYVHKPIAFGELLEHIRPYVPLEGPSTPEMNDAAIVIEDDIQVEDPDEFEATYASPTTPKLVAIAAEVDAFADSAFDHLMEGGFRFSAVHRSMRTRPRPPSPIGRRPLRDISDRLASSIDPARLHATVERRARGGAGWSTARRRLRSTSSPASSSGRLDTGAMPLGACFGSHGVSALEPEAETGERVSPTCSRVPMRLPMTQSAAPSGIPRRQFENRRPPRGRHRRRGFEVASASSRGRRSKLSRLERDLADTRGEVRRLEALALQEGDHSNEQVAASATRARRPTSKGAAGREGRRSLEPRVPRPARGAQQERQRDPRPPRSQISRKEKELLDASDSALLARARQGRPGRQDRQPRERDAGGAVPLRDRQGRQRAGGQARRRFQGARERRPKPSSNSSKQSSPASSRNTTAKSHNVMRRSRHCAKSISNSWRARQKLARARSTPSGKRQRKARRASPRGARIRATRALRRGLQAQGRVGGGAPFSRRSARQAAKRTRDRQGDCAGRARRRPASAVGRSRRRSHAGSRGRTKPAQARCRAGLGRSAGGGRAGERTGARAGRAAPSGPARAKEVNSRGASRHERTEIESRFANERTELEARALGERAELEARFVAERAGLFSERSEERALLESRVNELATHFGGAHRRA